MIKKNKHIVIPLAIVGAILIYSLTVILTTEIIATWKQYLGLAFFLIIVILFIKKFVATSVVLTGIFLLLGTFNLLAITPSIDTVGIRFSESTSTPPFQPLLLGIFGLYLWLNLDSLIDIHLDYKESKLNKIRNKKN